MNISWSEIKPYVNELPTNYADRIGRLYTDTVTAAFKKSSGQFFTPVSIAYFMGKQINADMHNPVPANPPESYLQTAYCGTKSNHVP